MDKKAKNVLGTDLEACCYQPQTGFFRDGFCHTGPQDRGSHTVCSEVNQEFLEFSKSKGNDLSTPRPEVGFPGLQEGDRWCLCVLRWKEAFEAGVAPPVIIRACHETALQYVKLEDLKKYAIDLS